MWKSLLDSVVEAFAMCDPVTYMNYLECKRETERHAAVTPCCESIDRYVDNWVAFSEQMGLWQRQEDAGARAAVSPRAARPQVPRPTPTASARSTSRSSPNASSP